MSEDRCGSQALGVMGARLVCEQIAGHIGPHVEGRTYWDTAEPTAAADRAKAAEVRNEVLCNGGVPGWSALDTIAAAIAAARADGEAAADQRWRGAVEGLAEEWERYAERFAYVLHGMATRPDLREAQVLQHAAARLRGLTSSSEEETA